jgi:hypothetical protein
LKNQEFLGFASWTKLFFFSIITACLSLSNEFFLVGLVSSHQKILFKLSIDNFPLLKCPVRTSLANLNFFSWILTRPSSTVPLVTKRCTWTVFFVRYDKLGQPLGPPVVGSNASRLKKYDCLLWGSTPLHQQTMKKVAPKKSNLFKHSFTN